MAMMRDVAPSTYILASRSETPLSGTPPLLPIPLPHLLLPSTDCRVGESSSAPTARPTRGFRADYGFVGTLDGKIRRDPKKEDTHEIYGRLDDAQDNRLLMSGESTADYYISTVDRDRGVAGIRPIIFFCDLKKMAPKRTTRSTPVITTTPTTFVTDEQLKRLIDQGVADALAAREADRSRNGKDSHDSCKGVTRQAPPAREYA
ncbi:hypothetical protein Tco_0360445 [Tanacetum coccineum]